MTESVTIKELKRTTKQLATAEAKVDSLRLKQRLLIKKALSEGLKGVQVAALANVSKSWVWQIKEDYQRKTKNADS